MTTSDTFDPTKHGFRKLNMDGPGDLKWFEREFSGIDQDDKPDPLRLNIYLTRDKDYTTIWFGLLDASMAEITLGLHDDPKFDFSKMYEEVYFCGMIQNNEFGAKVLEATTTNRLMPCALRINGNGQLECYALGFEVDEAVPS